MSKPTESGKAQSVYGGDYVRAAEKTDTYEQEQKHSECAGHI